ncbi:hypothetical protein Ssi03_08620 [Sphaerisporangium siamense]|uniref:Uncharacterized protein n=1 Tax=Sphaerisporangium siamense TaxID=795645 RepID=A0A7W7GDL8_9ACTN|nr:hypothetical protein [Sphaerisporangium siamense]MBB4705742.1 hypothetical protein [Sphaerisporangium siamense]GII82872.1 hypothetical protein Ssi03_08620 [Sphaerisporangium siamense]
MPEPLPAPLPAEGGQPGAVPRAVRGVAALASWAPVVAGVVVSAGGFLYLFFAVTALVT